jgi:uncharacterized protein YdaU (DUF1376 family)
VHYYQFNIGDYARDTGHLTVLEHGIYRLLLDWVYLNEKPITTEQAIRVSRGNPTETQSVLSEFFSQVSDGWMHKRVSDEIAHYHAKAEVNRQNGQKGGRPKPTNNPVGSQTVAKHNPNQEPITNNHKPVKTPHTPQGGFDEFWAAYPKKTGKAAAMKAWAKLKNKTGSLAGCLEALRWQRTSDQWTKDGGQYVPNPATYLNQERWLDEPIEIKTKPKEKSYHEQLRETSDALCGRNRRDSETVIDGTATRLD